MLVSSKAGRWAAWLLFAALFLPVYGIPFAVLGLASVAKTWDTAIPHAYTAAHYAGGLAGDSRGSLLVSLITGVVASVIALLIGGWAAIAAHRLRRRARRAASAVFLAPVAVPSVVIGLSALIAFSHAPLLLSGLPAIVIVVQVVIITAFAYQNISAALTRLDPAYAQVAASLGGSPGYVLRRITLPLLTPALAASMALCFALSMGELGATIMVYPPSWATLPVWIFGLSDRGLVFDAAAMTVLLLAVTVAVLLALSRVRTRASYR